MILNISFALALQATITSALQIASIGSSFAAGPGIPAGKNYAQLLNTKINQVVKSSVADLSVAGSTLLGIGPQIDQIPADTDIVTITSGGNDLGYVAGFTGSPGSNVSEDKLLGRYNDVLARIHSKAPKAKVYLVEYLTLLGADADHDTSLGLTASKIASQREIASTLQKATNRAAQGKKWAEDVPVAKLSESHGVGSAVPWVNGNKVSGGGILWHPNSAGMEAVAEILFNIIKKSGVITKACKAKL